MGNLQRYHAADLPALMERIHKNSLGMENYFDRFLNLQDSVSNYPPYNIVQVNNVESRLEIALAGFKKDEVQVYRVWKTICTRQERRTRRRWRICLQRFGTEIL